MKKLTISLIALAVCALCGTSAAQTSSKETGHASAKIISKIKIKKGCGLDFGNVLTDSGTVHITGSGSESYTGSARPGSQPGNHTSAEFLVTGEPGFAYALQRSPGDGILRITDGSGHQATAKLDAAIPVSGTLGTLSTPAGNAKAGEEDEHGNSDSRIEGSQVFTVGGVISIPSGQHSGSYSNVNTGGTPWFETVSYN